MRGAVGDLSDGHRQYRVALVVDMLADQVHTSCRMTDPRSCSLLHVKIEEYKSYKVFYLGILRHILASSCGWTCRFL